MGKGKLVITVKTARLTRDTDTLGKMEPYCKLKYDGVKQKTKVHKSGGKTPSWDETFTYDVTDCTILTIAIWDKDTFSNDEVGTAQLDVNTLKTHGGLTDWVKLQHKGKEVGEIYVEIMYVDKSGAKPGGVMPAPAPAPVPIPGGHGGHGGYPVPAPAPMPVPVPGGHHMPTPGVYPSPVPGAFPTPSPTPGAHYSPMPGGHHVPSPGGVPGGIPGVMPGSHGGDPSCHKCYGSGYNSKKGKSCKCVKYGHGGHHGKKHKKDKKKKDKKKKKKSSSSSSSSSSSD